MTQKVRWLAALALLLAFGAGSVRAEEEEEVAPPAHKSAELLPTAAAPCRQGRPSCACSAKCRANEAPADAVQYVVATKIVHANADGDCDETMSPKVTVFEGQTANFAVYGEQTAKESRNFSMQIRVASVEKGYRLNLSVEDRLDCHDAKSGEHTETDLARTNCNVTLGKMKRLVLKKDADGTDRTWAEVVVTAITPEDDAADSPLDCVGEALGDLIDMVADVATSLFGDDAEVQQAEFTTPVVAAPRDYPVPVTAPCPACRQCVAVEAVKKPGVFIHIDAENNRARLEFRGENKSWKASARQISLVEGNLVLEGDVQCEGNDSSPFCQTDKIKIQLPNGADIKVGD
jgi:hypothetical protein